MSRVVELVIEHATTRPNESLGRHRPRHHARRAHRRSPAPRRDHQPGARGDRRRRTARSRCSSRIWSAFRATSATRSSSPSVTGARPTAACATTSGPINQEGGQRRLNVAITRARRRMTVVSSFTGGEMDPARTRSVGSVMLRDYLLYAESGGKNLGLRALDEAGAEPVRAGREGAAGGSRPHPDAPVRRLGLLDRLRRHAPGAPERAGARDRSGRRHVPLGAGRTRPRPPAPGAPRTPRLALPPHLVDRLVPSARSRDRRCPRRLRGSPASRTTAGRGATHPVRHAGPAGDVAATGCRRRRERARPLAASAERPPDRRLQPVAAAGGRALGEVGWPPLHGRRAPDRDDACPRVPRARAAVSSRRFSAPSCSNAVLSLSSPPRSRLRVRCSCRTPARA